VRFREEISSLKLALQWFFKRMICQLHDNSFNRFKIGSVQMFSKKEIVLMCLLILASLMKTWLLSQGLGYRIYEDLSFSNWLLTGVQGFSIFFLLQIEIRRGRQHFDH
jgi:hypothetical protein